VEEGVDNGHVMTMIMPLNARKGTSVSADMEKEDGDETCDQEGA
jgi:hypothetical protein